MFYDVKVEILEKENKMANKGNDITNFKCKSKTCKAENFYCLNMLNYVTLSSLKKRTRGLGLLNFSRTIFK